MAIPNRPITKLVRNIAHELSDHDLHPDLEELKNPLDDQEELPVAAEFVPLAADCPYYEVITGDAQGSGDSGRRDDQVVEIHIVHAILHDEQGGATLMGYDEVSGLLDLREAVEEALLRPGSPYTSSTYNTDGEPYETIDEVRAVWKNRTVRQDFITDPEVEGGGAIYVRSILEFVYAIEKGVVGG